tara:strand:+ start:584 stop:841 length:258 start_codon:yes stop_codon:yes gene_type:complete
VLKPSLLQKLSFFNTFCIFIDDQYHSKRPLSKGRCTLTLNFVLIGLPSQLMYGKRSRTAMSAYLANSAQQNVATVTGSQLDHGAL